MTTGIIFDHDGYCKILQLDRYLLWLTPARAIFNHDNANQAPKSNANKLLIFERKILRRILGLKRGMGRAITKYVQTENLWSYSAIPILWSHLRESLKMGQTLKEGRGSNYTEHKKYKPYKN